MSHYDDLAAGVSNLAVRWRLGESSGAGASDASGNGRDGTYIGGVTLGAAGLLPSNPGQTAATFGGGYVRRIASVPYPSGLTMAAWVRPSALPEGNHAMVLSHATDGGNCYLSVYNRQPFVKFNYANHRDESADPATLSVGTVHHLSATLDFASGAYALYLDGQAVDAGTDTNGISAITGLYAGTFGNSVGDLNWTGDLAECLTAGAALDAAEVAALYAAGISPPLPSGALLLRRRRAG